MEGMPRQLRAERCNFELTRLALRELAGGYVGMEVSQLSGSATWLTTAGKLGEIHDLNTETWQAFAFSVADVTVRITERTFESGWREEYVSADGQLRWRLVAIELSFGVMIEVEEIPVGEGEIAGRHPQAEHLYWPCRLAPFPFDEPEPPSCHQASGASTPAPRPRRHRPAGDRGWGCGGSRP